MMSIQKTPAVQSCFGTLFGSALWLAADEIAVPAFGLAKPPREHPASTHITSWASHLVYGLTAELVRRGLHAL